MSCILFKDSFNASILSFVEEKVGCGAGGRVCNLLVVPKRAVKGDTNVELCTLELTIATIAAASSAYDCWQCCDHFDVTQTT
ncbi:hypothetical protein ADUPG1_001454 [Aduncisulcus paluster]|uniref:Uncharacterized protein n=2 Tax=Aduncisulcus paluster TaxID=2918883 RepID=A0ABQ5KCI5_9EUKA|nr:hypothetical protein ADUPG1_001454 [Aduncisulcus paluster]